MSKKHSSSTLTLNIHETGTHAQRTHLRIYKKTRAAANRISAPRAVRIVFFARLCPGIPSGGGGPRLHRRAKARKVYRVLRNVADICVDEQNSMPLSCQSWLILHTMVCRSRVHAIHWVGLRHGHAEFLSFFTILCRRQLPGGWSKITPHVRDGEQQKGSNISRSSQC